MTGAADHSEELTTIHPRRTPVPAAPAPTSRDRPPAGDRRRITPWQLAVAVAAVLVLGLPLAWPGPVDAATAARVEGENRFATAAAVAELAFPGGTSRAVIATSVAPADALAGMSLAGVLDAAVLLTRPGDLPAETAQALGALDVAEVVLIGGTDVISQAVEDALAERYVVSRIAGSAPWDTAAAVGDATVAVAGGVPQLSAGPTVFLANPERFPDALASSSAAYTAGIPILYTTRDEVRGEVVEFLRRHGVGHVAILGGVEAISEAVETTLRLEGQATTRLAGDSRVETSLFVAGWTAEEVGFGGPAVILARGDDFPDAVTSGQLGGAVSAPVILSATPSVLPQTAQSWLAESCAALDVVQAVGGVDALSVDVLRAATNAAGTC